MKNNFLLKPKPVWHYFEDYQKVNIIFIQNKTNFQQTFKQKYYTVQLYIALLKPLILNIVPSIQLELILLFRINPKHQLIT